jgi:hypothetical protein
MGHLKKEILIGLMFIAGIGSFLSGQFIISTLLFAIAAIYCNILLSAKFDIDV